MMNSKPRGSPGFRKQGKCGRDFLNHFHAISSPDFENYDECFPSLSGAKSKAPIKELSSAVNIPRGATTSTVPLSVYDYAEEGRRLERLTVVALKRAKIGRSPLTQEEANHLESWQARYRASRAQNPNQNVPPMASNDGAREEADEEGEAVVGEHEDEDEENPKEVEEGHRKDVSSETGNRSSIRVVSPRRTEVKSGEIISRAPPSDEPPTSEADDHGDSGSGEDGTTSEESEQEGEGEGEAITLENVGGTSEASVPELNLVFSKCSEVSEQVKAGDRGNKVPFLPGDNFHSDLISNAKCCVDVVSYGSPSSVKMNFHTGHKGSGSVPAHHVFDENPQLVSVEGTGEAVSTSDILVDGSEGHCDNVKERGKMVLSSEGKKSVTVQGESLNQDRMSQGVAAASKPIAVASLPRSWLTLQLPMEILGPFWER
ncbi:hypothetical protein U1Q18_047205 [Sarracenia purpurea var. burkii]